MLATVAHVVLGLVLVGSAAAKLAAPGRTRAALATFGLRDLRAQFAVWTTAVAAEAALGVAVALGSDLAAYGAAALMGLFAAALAAALRRGRAGAPCGCLGPRSRVSNAALVRTLVLAGAFALVPRVPGRDLGAEAWLAIGLVLTLAALAALAVLVFALAREVGELRLALRPDPALEIVGEGPPLGERVAAIDRFSPTTGSRFALAVFSSDGCPMCHALAPAVDRARRDPSLAVRVFDEREHDDVWRALKIPGSPYAVVLDLAGAVLAQGTFNSARQLDSLVATAAARERELAHAA